MSDKNDDQQTQKNHKEPERRSGKDRRKVHTMIDPDKDKRISSTVDRSQRAVKQMTAHCLKYTNSMKCPLTAMKQGLSKTCWAGYSIKDIHQYQRQS